MLTGLLPGSSTAGGMPMGKGSAMGEDVSLWAASWGTTAAEPLFSDAGSEASGSAGSACGQRRSLGQ